MHSGRAGGEARDQREGVRYGGVSSIAPSPVATGPGNRKDVRPFFVGKSEIGDRYRFWGDSKSGTGTDFRVRTLRLRGVAVEIGTSPLQPLTAP